MNNATQSATLVNDDSDLAGRASRWVSEQAALADSPVAQKQAMIDHCAGVAGILESLGADPAARAAAWVYPFESVAPADLIEREFGGEVARVCTAMRKLRALTDLHRVQGDEHDREAPARLETLRRMLLAMSVDLRVVLLRLASRLQNLRSHAASGIAPEAGLCRETLELLAPLANRLGLWQLKWEMEDLSFRFLNPTEYYGLAGSLSLKRAERVQLVDAAVARLESALVQAGLEARVSGRPKHIYSIWRKMQDKRLPFTQIHDLLALRVVVDSVEQCYQVLDVIHQAWEAVGDQYEDYIGRPKANGYQSLHEVVVDPDGIGLEIQVRTLAMHEAAEYGAAAHWQYKEATPGSGRPENAGFEKRVAWLRQLLDWQREMGESLGADGVGETSDDHVYVLTPAARVIALPSGSTPVDFAYHLHTDLGHQCRGVRVDGRMVPLSTPLQTGQTVSIVTVSGRAATDPQLAGPSRDWLNPALGFLASRRAQNKVRQWFATQEVDRERAEGRALVERVLQREGKTQLALDMLAERLGFDSTGALYTAVAHGDIGPRAIERAANGAAPVTRAPFKVPAVATPTRASRAGSNDPSAVLVEGVGSLMSSLAGCCKPMPGDAIQGFVTVGRGVRVHRKTCQVLVRLRGSAPERLLAATWSEPGNDTPGRGAGFHCELLVRGVQRAGLTEEVIDVFARRHVQVLANDVQTRGEQVQYRIGANLSNVAELGAVLSEVRRIAGIQRALRS